jgi:2-dehydro-3-deoxygluconokinase
MIFRNDQRTGLKNMKKTVVGFGELLGAVRPRGFEAWGDSNNVVICAGGSEANVLAKIGGLTDGVETQFISKIKQDLLGRLLRYELQRFSVGLEYLIWTNQDRNGFCFVEQGLGPITAVGEYDRAFTAFSQARVGEFDFSIFGQTDAFFVSGITPALSKNCLENTLQALKAADKNNVASFIDVNYRNKLWTPQQAGDVLLNIIDQELLTCLVATETDARVVFGIDHGFSDEKPLHELIEISHSILHEMNARFQAKVPLLVLTIRKRISNERGEWTSAALVHGQTFVVGEPFPYVVLDRYGAGDSFTAGLIGGYLGIIPNGSVSETSPLEERVQVGLDLGNRMSVVTQKTVSDLGPQWSAEEYFSRIGAAKEISR